MDGRNFKSRLDMTALPAGARGTASQPDWCRRLMSGVEQRVDEPGMLQAEHHEGSRMLGTSIPSHTIVLGDSSPIPVIGERTMAFDSVHYGMASRSLQPRSPTRPHQCSLASHSIHMTTSAPLGRLYTERYRFSGLLEAPRGY